MKKTIILVVDEDTTVPHLLNGQDYEIISTAKDDTFCMVKKVSGWEDTPSTNTKAVSYNPQATGGN